MAHLADSAALDEAAGDTCAQNEQWTIEKAVEGLPGMTGGDSGSPVGFFHLLERLKTTKRAGWQRYGILQGESVADHMFRMATLSLFAPPPIIIDKCVKISLIHDMAEAIVGDITPAGGVSRREKNRREAEAIEFIAGTLLKNGSVGNQIRELWKEFEESETRESRFVQDLDKLEMLLQMVEYEKRAGGDLNLDEFAYARKKISDPDVSSWADEILGERESYWNGQKPTTSELSAESIRQQEEYYS